MKFEIGIGTFRITEDFNRGKDKNSAFNLDDYKKEEEALLYSFSKGQNFISISYLYDNGKTVEFLKSFMNKISRDKMFLAINIEDPINSKEDIEKQLDMNLKLLGTDYADLIQLHTPIASRIPLNDTYREMERLVEKGKAKYIGVSNFNIDELKYLVDDLGISIFSYEGMYNLECKQNEDIGILDYCNQKGIMFIGYQVLRRNRTARRNYSLLTELSEKYNKTQNQILINWIIKEKGIMPLIKSTTISHIDENIDGLNFVMDKEDYKRLNEFRSEEFDKLIVDWNNDGRGIRIDQIPNQFE